MVVVYLFHRDLRLPDHRGLEAAHKKAIELKTVILPLFVFTPEQVTSNKLKSVNSIQFMIASLQSLDMELKEKKSRLVCCYGDTVEVLKALDRKLGVECVIDVKDYTPYAKERIKALQDSNIPYECIEDSYLTAPGSVVNGTGKPYQKFTPFWTAARKVEVPHPTAAIAGPFIVRSGGGKKTRSLRSYPMEVSLETMRRRLVPHPNEEIAVKGGREEGQHFMHSIPSNYEKIHDIPSQSTSMLSAHLHFGTVSIREVYWEGKKKGLDAFVRQLYWREFYANIMDAFELLYKAHPYEFQKDRVVTDKQKEAFDKWCKGETGVPMVDAGMKQMLRTGYMHNRARLVVANWLVKDMHVHWRLGERFFAQHLVDYGLANNMMNWIWVASVLPFSQAPFRKVDAYRTAEKFDPDGVYIASHTIWPVKVIYSIGVRCYTEMILKRLNLIKFSSIFGSLNIRNYTNLIKCFDTDFKILLDEKYLLYSKNIVAMAKENEKYGFRTIHKLFNDVENYHSATIAHHNLSVDNIKQHFLRGIERLTYIKENKIPILFVNISMEFDNTHYNPQLIDSILKNGFINMKILSIYYVKNLSEVELVHISEYHIIYKIPAHGPNDTRDDATVQKIIDRHFKCDKLMTVDDFPKNLKME